MKIHIGDKTYSTMGEGSASLSDLLRLQKDTGLTRKDLRLMRERVAALPQDEIEESEDALILTAVTVWLARRKAGEQLTMEEACDFPLGENTFEAEDSDEEAAAADPTQAVGSREVENNRPVASDRLKKRTSKKASIDV